MYYYICYVFMVIGFFGCSVMSPDIKTKVIGLLLTVVNILIFWK